MDEAPMVQRVLDALAEEPVRVLATVGDHVDRSTLTAPANATITGYLRHLAVLPHASLLICHGGLGSVVAGLTVGVPILCIPLGREQPTNAERVTDLGAGLSLPPTATEDQIRTRVAIVLSDSAYELAAKAISEKCKADLARHRAVTEVEALLS
jgi:MGT family glycosyltransferase